MKLITLQKNLRQGVFVTSFLTGKGNLPILSNLMIEAKNGVIKFIATDLEIGVTNTIRAKVEAEGAFTVEAKVLANYINLLPNQKVELKVKDADLLVESDNYKTKIKGSPAEEYPLIPEVSGNDFCSVDKEDFKKAVAGVLFAVSNDTSRQALSGVLLVINKEEMCLAGTDSYRLAERKIKCQSSYTEEKRLIVPTKTLQEFLRIINGDYADERDSKETLIYFNDNQIAFKFDSVEIVSRLIDEQYPDYTQIIPTNFKTKALINKEEFFRAVKAAAIFSKTGVNDINLDFLNDKKELVVSATSGQSGESIINLSAKLEGGDNSVTINYKYLIDGLSHMDAELIGLNVNDANAPCLLKPEGQEGCLYIIMPIKR